MGPGLGVDGAGDSGPMSIKSASAISAAAGVAAAAAGTAAAAGLDQRELIGLAATTKNQCVCVNEGRDRAWSVTGRKRGREREREPVLESPV